MKDLLRKILVAAFAIFVAVFAGVSAEAAGGNVVRSLGAGTARREVTEDNVNAKKAADEVIVVDLDAGDEPASAGENGASAPTMSLEEACQNCNSVEFDKCLEAPGATSRIRRYRGEGEKTLLHELCSKDITDLSAFEHILDKLVEADPSIIGQKNINGNTALHYVITGGDDLRIKVGNTYKVSFRRVDFRFSGSSVKKFENRRAVAEMLLKRSPKVANAVNRQEKRRYTLLWRA